MKSIAYHYGVETIVNQTNELTRLEQQIYDTVYNACYWSSQGSLSHDLIAQYSNIHIKLVRTTTLRMFRKRRLHHHTHDNTWSPINEQGDHVTQRDKDDD